MVFFNFQEHNSNQAVKDAFDSIVYKGGLTPTGLSLRKINTDVINGLKNRKDVPDVVVVVTDGDPFGPGEPERTKKEAALLEAEGVKIIAVGVGRNIKEDTLLSIASMNDPDYVLRADDFNQLYLLIDRLIGKVCKVNGGWSEWSQPAECTRTCGGGTQTRSRTCTNPAPKFGGFPCEGASTETSICNVQQCPVHGGWSEWSQPAECTKTCGGGVQARSRACTNPTPKYGGAQCDGASTETSLCNTQQCPINGQWSEWSKWSECSVSCGEGIRERKRMCSNPPPQNGGSGCEGNSMEREVCGTERPCPIDGSWALWSEWSCPVTCGTGKASRSRTCTNPLPQFGGKQCKGSRIDTKTCERPSCGINGAWTQWTNWECSISCGAGKASRTRACANPRPQHGGKQCEGSDIETRFCERPPCGIDGGWTMWAEWECEVTCGTGLASRSRACTNPSPQSGGKQCEGSGKETRICERPSCGIDGQWSQWSLWECSVTCGTGTASRMRACNNPPPSSGGKSCEGASFQTQPCRATRSCPIDGGWSEWTSWSCSVTCGSGIGSRTRTCTNPPPQFGGKTCSGQPNNPTRACNLSPCPIDGSWSEWSAWTCSVTCGLGTSTRTRTCTNPPPQNGGKTCSGLPSDPTRTCNPRPCPIHGGWSPWSIWSCSVTCGSGIESRSRACTNPPPQFGGKTCSGQPNNPTRMCNLEPCSIAIDGGWSEWSEYTCSVTCGLGTASRTRTCTNPPPQNGGKTCSGLPSDPTRTCNPRPCPIDGGWSFWTPWSCSVTCGAGIESRSRTCTNPSPQFGGKTCSGQPNNPTRTCNLEPCTTAIDGGWSNWSAWTCSKTCGIGTSTRTRTCTNPPPQNGGKTCSGQPSDPTRTCNLGRCPIDGGWSAWSSWTCSVTCGTGVESRSRTCTNPPPQNGGKTCSGQPTDPTRTCNLQPCEESVDGQWGQWQPWGGCSVSCGGGQRRRQRACDSPAPQNGGRPCAGLSTQIGSCSIDIACPPPPDVNAKDFCFRCRGRRNQKDYYENPANCSTYFHCFFLLNGGVEGILRECPPNQRFDEGILSCVPMINGLCSDPCNTTSVQAEGFWPDETDCGTYYQCSNYHSLKNCCPVGLKWDQASKICVRSQPPCDSDCLPAEPITVPMETPTLIGDDRCKDQYDVTYEIQPGDQSTFFVVLPNGAKVKFECGLGSFFELATCKCSGRFTTVVPLTQQPDQILNISCDPEILDHSVYHFYIDNLGASKVDTDSSQRCLFGNQNNLEVPGFQTISLGDRVTIMFCAMVQCAEGTTAGLLSNRGGTNNDELSILFQVDSVGNLVVILETETSGSISLSTALQCGQYTHIALQYDGTQAVLYINGQQVTTQPGSGMIAWMRHCPLSIGHDQLAGYLNGVMDDVLIYRRLLVSLAFIQSRSAMCLANNGP